MLQIYDIKLDIDRDESLLPQKILKRLHLDSKTWSVSDWVIVKKSIDARDKSRIVWVYTLRFALCRMDGRKVYEDQLIGQAKSRKIRLKIASDERYVIPSIPASGYGGDTAAKIGDTDNMLSREDGGKANGEENYAGHRTGGKRPVVVGFGPCGIFAAYVLAKAGLNPIVLERGRPIEERTHHVDAYWRYGTLREDSNVLFGEGGAGTFSDGKLTTGIEDPRKTFVLETFAGAGGGEDILYLGKPHLGTDVLKTVVKNLRKEIISLGGEVRFGQKFVGLETENGKVSNVICEAVQMQAIRNQAYIEPSSMDQAPIDQTAKTLSASDSRFENEKSQAAKEICKIATDHVVLAMGHSARDTVSRLLALGLNMEQKPFSMGVRIEHPQALIDRSQYGETCDHKLLPAAEYKLSCRATDGRGVYTFCMCPGGRVVAASSEVGTICTNGMSERARDGLLANSAVLVDVRPDDFGGGHIPAGIELQRQVEKKAYDIRQELLSTGDNFTNAYTPLCESVKNFTGEDSLLAKCLPDFVTQGIKDALPVFGRKISGFDSGDVMLLGPETRSSSPVRMIRDANMQSNINGAYPCGEGAGYAGGIMSAAVDGIKVSEQIIRDLSTTRF